MQKKYFFSLSFLLFGCFVLLQAQKAGGNEVISVVNGERLAQGEHKIFYGASTLENQRGGNGKAAYANQDRVVICSLLGRTACILCDGHGKEGDLVAAKISSLLPVEVCKYRDLVYGFETGISKLQKALTNQKYAQESGTTCVGAVIAEDKLAIANVGDSRLMVVRADKVIFSTIDHKPTESQEINRIKNAGGYILNGYVYNKQGTMGLALTRSLGDMLAHDKDVITAQPDTTELTMQSGDCIVLGSDGLWDAVTNDEVRKQIARSIQEWNFKYTHSKILPTTTDLCTDIADKLTQLARSRKSIDDITCVALMYERS